MTQTPTRPTPSPAASQSLGIPLWVDLAARDVQAAARFYGQLFGWQAEDQGEQMGHYSLFRQDGKMVGAVGPLQSEQQPSAWMTYFGTPDAAATAEAVRAAGGQVIVEPFAVMDLGTMAVFSDPSGAFFSVWQPGLHQGAELTNVPNSFCWNELATRDIEAAKAFYPRVFGWGVQSNQMPDGGQYVEWQVGGRSIAGGQSLPSQYPAQVPPHWLTYFAVADCDATASQAQALGGRVLSPPIDIPQGRFAILSDPQGATFGVIRL